LDLCDLPFQDLNREFPIGTCSEGLKFHHFVNAPFSLLKHFFSVSEYGEKVVRSFPWQRRDRRIKWGSENPCRDLRHEQKGQISLLIILILLLPYQSY